MKKFVRENEGNVLSSGDSGSNLGSIGDRDLIKTAGHGAGMIQYEEQSEIKRTVLSSGTSSLHFNEDVEIE